VRVSFLRARGKPTSQPPGPPRDGTIGKKATDLGTASGSTPRALRAAERLPEIDAAVILGKDH
jgi:hypothetical protein